MDTAFLLISLLNGLSLGLLLFMLASGLTLIFSLMGVLNFAHAGFYMLGAYLGWQIGQWLGFWMALLLAPLLLGLAGAACERYLLRPMHRHGHVPELLVTFGLGVVIVEAVQLVWGRQPLPFEPPAALHGPLLALLQTPGGLQWGWGSGPAACQGEAAASCLQFPAFRAFAMLLAVAVLGLLAGLLRYTRAGLVIQAATTHAQAVQALGHDVPRVTMWVFGVGTALAGLAGVVGGALRVTDPTMALSVGATVFAVIVIGGLGSLGGAFVAALGLGLLESLATASGARLGDLLPGAATPATGALQPLLDLRLAQVASVLPYLVLVAVLVFRPRGLFGTREG